MPRLVLEHGPDVLHDALARDLCLRMTLELFYLDHAAVELRIAEHEAHRRAEAARAPKQALQGAAARVELHDHAAPPQVTGEREPLEGRALADRCDETAPGARRGEIA